MSDERGGQQTGIGVDPSIVGVWEKYEDVAMHFNELIMRWRLQAIGGLAGLVMLAGFVVGDAESLLVRYRAMLLLTMVLSFVWIGVSIIDLFYYRRLLQGSVDAILSLESKVKTIDLSTAIENRARRGSEIAPWIFYACGLLPLLVIMGCASFQLYGLAQQNAAPQP